MKPIAYDSRNRVRIAIALIGLLLLMCVEQSAAQQKNPITKKNLLGSLQYRKLGPEEYVSNMKECGVDFQLTVDDERAIRRAGRYLGKQGLDRLIDAVRNNYRPNNLTQQNEANLLKNGDSASPLPVKMTLLFGATNEKGEILGARGEVVGIDRSKNLTISLKSIDADPDSSNLSCAFTLESPGREPVDRVGHEGEETRYGDYSIKLYELKKKMARFFVDKK